MFHLRSTWQLDKGMIIKFEDVQISGKEYPGLSIRLTVRRIPTYYIVNVAAPMSLLAITSLLMFKLPAPDVNDRMALSLTLLLTAVAYKLVTAGMTPEIGYLTFLDQFVLGCCLLILLTVFIGAFSDDAHYDDTVVCYTTIALCVALHVFFGGYMWWLWWKSRAEQRNRQARVDAETHAKSHSRKMLLASLDPSSRKSEPASRKSSFGFNL